jgi:hypothetical protein
MGMAAAAIQESPLGRFLVAWPQGWSAWRNRDKLPENLVYRDVPGRHEAPADGMIQTTGQADGCFACASHPGVVFRPSPNGEGHLPMPCPACESRRTPPGAQAP